MDEGALGDRSAGGDLARLPQPIRELFQGFIFEVDGVSDADAAVLDWILHRLADVCDEAGPAAALEMARSVLSLLQPSREADGLLVADRVRLSVIAGGRSSGLQPGRAKAVAP